MSDLQNQRCLACEGGVKPLSEEESQKMLAQIPDWDLNQEGKRLSRRFNFKNYYQTMAFVNAIAWMANRENHHPDLEVSYNSCLVHYSTHALGGLSVNDFICAAKVDALLV